MTDAEFNTMRREEGTSERHSAQRRQIHLSQMLTWLRRRALS